MKKIFPLLIIFFLSESFDLYSQRRTNVKNQKSNDNISLNAFQFRNVGPAFLSGRIADISIDPNNSSVWYVAVGSGGVWKTKNSGTTWTPIFDNQPSYSIGCITIDPNNTNTIWVGTGENVGGRHVGYGDGIYKSMDGGKTWKNFGLKETEHISKIIVHPENSDIILVAAQGPLWRKGEQRGLYYSDNGGKNWKKVLGNSEWTGVTDIVFNHLNPQVMYAATWDRHRTVAAYMGGGPGTAIFKSIDGGKNWEKLSTGLPKSNMGKIGLAISPQRPNVVYAAIELDRTTGGLYRSDDAGNSWTKMSDEVSGGTGPHYYQELYASPHSFDRIYLMNVRVRVSEDGGKTFRTMKERQKHSDNHEIVFKHDDPNYLMIGTDAGIYESFDLAENWSYLKNLPLTQFYKVAVNNAEPFYHIFGGTQDNGSAGGPSATDEREGIANKHWYKTLGADGHQSATDPIYNDIIYAETQRGGLHRIDLTSGEQVFIQPQAYEGDPFERFNWDAPILVSPHKPSRLYFASYRLWKSENRGDDWIPISGDLTRNEERITLPIMGRTQSWDNAWDVGAMSDYNTITSISESPIKEGLIYIGTDDGFIQVTEDGGKNWNKISVKQFGLAGRSFVNDIKADLFDENLAYVVLDNHKEGDFKPYIFKSVDKGKNWVPISGNIPERNLVWRFVQDHVKKDLFFAATEFGVYTSLNGGKKWHKLPGTPTISFRDIVIQKRENDLVAASFGRGFYVLDDYSGLREMTPLNLKKEGVLFKPRPAKWYVPRSKIGNTGADYYFAKNPEFGAVFTYHLSKSYETKKSIRQKKERGLNKSQKNVPFPGWDILEEEKNQKSAQILLTIHDDQGNLVRKIFKKARKGSARIAWDLRYPSNSPIRPSSSARRGWGSYGGPMAIPGKYSANLHLVKDGNVSFLDGPIEFDVKPIREGVLKGVSYEDYKSFIKKYNDLQNKISAVSDALRMSENKLSLIETAVNRSSIKPGEINSKIYNLKKRIQSIKLDLNGNSAKREIGERNPPSMQGNLRVAGRGLNTTYGPTKLHERSLEIASSMLGKVESNIKELSKETLPSLEKEIKKLGVPYIMGQGIE
mgnify:FL=1